MYYPLEGRESAKDGWVDLAVAEFFVIDDAGNVEITFIERDNQGGPDAVIKLIQEFSVRRSDFLPADDAPNGKVVEKRFVLDLVPEVAAPAGAIIEKVEDLAVLPSGTAVICTENDGVDDCNRETQRIEIEGASPAVMTPTTRITRTASAMMDMRVKIKPQNSNR